MVEYTNRYGDVYTFPKQGDGQLAITTGEDGGDALIFFMSDSKTSYVFY